jgi:hypothetical protein
MTEWLIVCVLQLNDSKIQPMLLHLSITWRLVCVLQANDSDIQPTFFHRPDHSKYFMYPSSPNVMWV